MGEAGIRTPVSPTYPKGTTPMNQGPVPTPRSIALRKARVRALARLRGEYDKRFNELMDEELARLGEEPRVFVREYTPRAEWRSE